MSVQRQSSQWLINESPLMVFPSLATAIGLNEAIVLQQVHFWLGVQTCGKVVDGVRWIYNTVKDWKVQFPWWSRKTLERTLSNLRTRKLLKTANYNERPGDQTLWYTIDYDVLGSLPLPQNDEMVTPKMGKPLPDTTTETKEDKSSLAASPKRTKRVKVVTIDNATPEPHVALIEAYHYSLPDEIRPAKAAFGRYSELAAAMVKSGITPYDVVRYVVSESPGYQQWAAEHKAKPVMSLNHVDQEIKGWLLSHTTKPKGPMVKYTYVEHDDYVSETEAA